MAVALDSDQYQMKKRVLLLKILYRESRPMGTRRTKAGGTIRA